MTNSATPDAVVVERRIKASPATVFSFFTDPTRWLRWQGVDAEIEPAEGGTFRINVRGDGYASGRFLEIKPPHRIVFTWGWEMPGNPVPPGASTVEIDLVAEDDTTVVRLTHRDLPADTRAVHQLGWNHYMDRLAVVSMGDEPGADHWATGPPVSR